MSDPTWRQSKPKRKSSWHKRATYVSGCAIAAWALLLPFALAPQYASLPHDCRPLAAQAQGSPFDNGFTALQTLFTGTVAKVASLIAIVIGGYSLTRKRRERGYRREELTRFGRIPSHKATLIWLAARYAFVEKSILVVTEGLGQQRFHGRVVLLVNEHTGSAGEMVSAFAEENNLATIVGTKTPGRLLSGSAYKVGRGYILGLPVAAYLTWQGRMLESNGIVPNFAIELSREALREGKDVQLDRALDVAINL
jgi:hypothetical protein